ncbi:MAG: hypothetical protein RLZZ347_789 [Candidatus Parcubacteria bacterium]|jgi:lipopolysaccharide export LptBFGC system permease protein LptF
MVYNSLMYKLSFLMVCGVLVFLAPFLGLPSGHQMVLSCVLGVAVFFGAYFVRRGMRASELSDRESVVSVPVSDSFLSSE